MAAVVSIWHFRRTNTLCAAATCDRRLIHIQTDTHTQTAPLVALELEAETGAAGRRHLLRIELELIVVDRRCDATVLNLAVEILFQYVKGLFVDLLQLVRLQEFELVEACGIVNISMQSCRHRTAVLLTTLTRTLLDQHRIRIRTVVLLQLARLQYIVQSAQCDLHDFRVHHRQQLAHWPNAAGLHQILDLLGSATAGGIRDGPGDLFARFELRVCANVDQSRKDVGIDDRLDLFAIAGRDVGYRPGGFFADGLLVAAEQVEHARKCVAVEDDLGLVVVAGDDVADGAQRGGDDFLHFVSVVVCEKRGNW